MNSKLNQKKQPTADFNIYDLIPSRFIPIENAYNRVYCNLCNRIFKNDIVTIKKHWFNCSSLNKSFKDEGPNGYQCYNCDTGVISSTYFNNHVLTESHEKKCRGTTQYSFHSKMNNTMIYAPANIIKTHMKSEGINHYNSVPVLSKFMKMILDDFKLNREITSKWYVCMPCNLYDKVQVHSKKGCHNCKTHYYCASCNIEFICAKHVYNSHVYGCEHNLIANKINGKIGTLDGDPKKVKLPQMIINGFEFEKNTVKCKICNERCIINEQEIMNHTMYRCIRLHHDLLNFVNSTKVTDYFKCLVCRYEFHFLITWKLHVLSPSHLSRCYRNDNMRSDFCDTCFAHFYGDADSICCSNSSPNDRKKMSLLSKFMAELYKERDCSSIKKKLIYNESGKNDEQANDFIVDNLNAQMTSHYCGTCNAAFYCSPDVYEQHTLMVEHIVLDFVLGSRLRKEFDKYSLISQSNSDHLSKYKHFQMIMEKLNTLQNDSDERVVQTTSYYCQDCDFVMEDESLWEIHNKEIHDKGEYSGRSTGYCLVCNMYMSGMSINLDGHLATDQHIILKDLCNTIENVDNGSTNRTSMSGEKGVVESAAEEKLSEDDKCYLLYVGHRLKQIKDDSVKLKVKLSIDNIFCKSMKYFDL